MRDGMGNDTDAADLPRWRDRRLPLEAQRAHPVFVRSDGARFLVLDRQWCRFDPLVNRPTTTFPSREWPISYTADDARGVLAVWDAAMAGR